MTSARRTWLAGLAVAGASVGVGWLLWPSDADIAADQAAPAPQVHRAERPPQAWAPSPPPPSLPERLAELAAAEADGTCDVAQAEVTEADNEANNGCAPLSIPERLAALPDERPPEETAARALRFAAAEHRISEIHPELLRCLEGVRDHAQVTLRVRVDVPLEPGAPGRAVLESLEPGVPGAEPCVQRALDALPMPAGRAEDLRRPVHREAFYRFAHPILLPDAPG